MINLNQTAKFAAKIASLQQKMEFKKRKADLQLTADNYEEDTATSYGGDTLKQPDSHR